MTILFLIFGRMTLYVDALGTFAIGLESTLPIPQLYTNFSRRSLYGFRLSTLAGWVAGDAFKFVRITHSPLAPLVLTFAWTIRTGYFLIKRKHEHVPLQFIVYSLSSGCSCEYCNSFALYVDLCHISACYRHRSVFDPLIQGYL